MNRGRGVSGGRSPTGVDGGHGGPAARQSNKG